jgi:hypothetical protein
MRHVTRKKIALVVVLVVAAIAAIGGYAYFSANGSGSGTATVGTSTNIVLHGSTTGTLYPGASVPINFTADNPGGGTERLGTIYLSGVKACTGASSSWDPSLNSGAGGCSNSGTEQTGCESVDPGNAGNAGASNFYMGDVTENQNLAGGSTGVSATNGGTLTMNNLSSSQDSCKNASLYLQLATR